MALYAIWTLPAFATDIQKPPLDPASYEYLELPNKMKVVLVSDPTATKAGATMNVAVGSFDEPAERAGLAHFLEHMLFLGTAKYPDPDSYHSFMSKHGGTDNAYTSAENTVYYFELDNAQLHEGLDRFSQFFIAPLFNSELVERERMAVESEYRAKVRDEPRRIGAALMETANPAHPYAHFAVGNQVTLGDRPGSMVRDELISFYQQHYSANLMTLAILGNEPLPVLRQWASELFSAIPNSDRSALQLDTPLYLPTQNPLRIDVVPLKDIRQMTMSFSVPWRREYYAIDPTEIFSELLGHEGYGSLYSVLKHQGWITRLNSGAGIVANNFASFDVDFDLTEEGIHHQDQIIALTFKYIDLIKARGIKRRFHDEVTLIKDNKFRFRDKSSPSNETTLLANNLQLYPPEFVIRGPYQTNDFNLQATLDMMAWLRPDNMRLIIVDPANNGDHRDQWYDTPYAVSALQPAKAVQGVSLLAKKLSLPPSNPFIPTDLSFKRNNQASTLPVKIHDSIGLEVWHQQDQEFGIPKADVFITIDNATRALTTRNTALLWAYLALVDDALDEYGYPANMAGLYYQVSQSLRGITIQLHGYNDKQARLLDTILDNMLKLKVEDTRLFTIKQRIIRDLINMGMDRPYIQSMNETSRLLNLNQPSREELIAAIKPLTRSDIKTFIKTLFGQARITLLAHGNLSPEQAIALGQHTQHRVSTIARVSADRSVRNGILLDNKTYVQNIPLQHDDSSIVVYYQAHDDDLDTQARFALLQQLLYSPFFNTLRTEQQLGYVVNSGGQSLYRRPGIRLVIQSSVAAPDVLLRKIDAFLAENDNVMSAITDQEFEAYRQGLLSELLKRDPNLSSRSQRYFGFMEKGYTDFRYQESLATAIRATTKQQIIDTYHQLFLGHDYGRLIVSNTGQRHHGTALPEQTVPITDVAAFRGSLPHYRY
ncbi:MAG: insulinase family protein [Gammaproteobacteria bacterium]|nr:insulinase family protein [Gammaproteobacteria bacterium]